MLTEVAVSDNKPTSRNVSIGPDTAVTVLVSPAEPKPFHALGKVSVTTEQYGADFLIATRTYGAVGVQRKTVDDLIASLHGDSQRFAKEMGQIKSLGLGVLLIEGAMTWTNDGKLVSRAEFTQAQMFGLIWSVQNLGLWVGRTTSINESIAWLTLFPKWLEKDRHRSLLDRGKSGVRGVWGQADNRDWGIWLLQGFRGIGYETAAAIYDYHKGVPLQWTITEEQMREVPGVGKGRARELITALSPDTSPPPNQHSSPPTAPASLSPTEPFIELAEIIDMGVIR